MISSHEYPARMVVLLENSSLHFGILTSDAERRLTVIAYRALSIPGVVQQGIIYNQTVIIDTLRECINAYNIPCSSLWLCVSGMGSWQTTVWHPHAHAERMDLWHVGLSSHAWDISHLYPADDNGFIIYVGGVRREIILQWQIICLRLSLSLAYLTTPFYALWHMYQAVFANAYRTAQLAADMNRVGLSLEQAVSPDALNRLFRSGTHQFGAQEVVSRAVIAGMGIIAHRA